MKTKRTGNKPKLTKVSTDLQNSTITIEYDNSQILTKYTKILLYKFLTLLNSYIGANTNLNYHILPVKNFTITIPIYSYTNDEKTLSTCDLIEKRVNTLLKHLETIDWNKHTNAQEQWLIYSLFAAGIDITNDLTISTHSGETSGFEDLDHQPLHINAAQLRKPKIKRVRYADGSTILYLSSPYLTDYGVFANLSTTFNEMNMSFNALHLYEHLMTYGWKGLNFDKVKLMNGSTWPHALCSVYVITQDLETLKLFAASFVKYYLTSRDKGFWKKAENVGGLKMETQRTISETRTERTLASLCRSDYHAYDYNYNTNIFEYWSNRPFDLLITGPDVVDKLCLNAETINLFISIHPIRNVPKPKDVVFRSLPLDTIKMKLIHQYRVVKANQAEIHDFMINPRNGNKALFGLDCKIISDAEDLNPYNSVLHMLCYINKSFSDEELNNFIKHSIIPFSATFFSETSLNSKFAGDYLFDPIADVENADLFEPFDAKEMKQTNEEPIGVNDDNE